MKLRKLFDDFKLVMWKNLLIKWRKPVATSIEMILPIVLCVCLCMLVKPPILNEKTTFEPFTVDIDAPPIAALLWSPCDNIFIKNVVQNVVQKMKIEDECYSNSQFLHKALQFSQGSKIVGIQFEDTLALTNTISGNINITLRFEDKVEGTLYYWRTNLLFPQIEEAGPREAHNYHGAAPCILKFRSYLAYDYFSSYVVDYYTDGFLSLQDALIEEILLSKLDNYKMPIIEMQRFPYPAWYSYKSLTSLDDLVGVALLIAFMNLFGNTLRSLASEKESQIKEIMKIMGLATWINWTTWFCTTLLTSIIPITVVVVLFKVSAIYGAKSSVFRLTDASVLFIFMIAFVCASTTFAFLISAFFSRPNTTSIAGWVVYILSALPYFPTKNSLAFNTLLSCILSNSAFQHGVKMIVHHEIIGEPLTIDHIFFNDSHSSVSIGFIICMLLLDSILYLLIALYVEAVLPGRYGLPKVWYFPFTKSFWLGRIPGAKIPLGGDEQIEHQSWYENEPADANVKVKVLKLNKKFGKNKIVLQDVCFNALEGEITVVTGYAGAGKTTILSILAGILPPTTGTAIISGYNITRDMTEIRRHLGFCPQSDVLWGTLTAAEHLYFFSKLKGVPKGDIPREIEGYLTVLELTKQKNVKCRRLSQAMKRKLSVGIALCGRSEICLFDNPTTGMDTLSRRKLWDFIKSQKQNRTILWSTNNIQEAEFLGDRIGILANGIMRCYGTPAFMKKTYGSGYRLTVVKNDNTDTPKINQLLRSHVPNVEIEHGNPRELNYLLQEKDSPKFQELFKTMETHGKEYGIHSFRIFLVTMEEVLMSVKVGVDITRDDHFAGSVSEYVLASNRYVAQAHATAVRLYQHQLLAMFLKKILITWRKIVSLLMYLLIILAFIFALMQYLKITQEFKTSPTMVYTLDSYDSPVTLITTDNTSNAYYVKFKEILGKGNHEIIDWGGDDMETRALEKTSADTHAFRTHVLFGASFKNDTIIVWFNNQPFHSQPLALQYVLTTVVKVDLGENYATQFQNSPSRHATDARDTLRELTHGAVYGAAIGIAMCCVTPYYATLCVEEKMCRSKHLQMVSGTAVTAFWLISFLWDFTTLLFVSLCMVAVLKFYEAHLTIGALIMLLILFSIAALPMMYLLSFLFSKASSAYATLTFVTFILGPLIFGFNQMLMPIIFPTADLSTIHKLLLTLPHYNLASGVYNLTKMEFARITCNYINKLQDSLVQNDSEATIYDDYACFTYPERCCDLLDMSTVYGIGQHVAYLIVMSLVLFGILFIIEFRLPDFVIYEWLAFVGKTPPDEGTSDRDVLLEKQRVRNDTINHTLFDVVLKDITKYYGNIVVVNQLCLGIKRSQCFGLLGLRGAGKTSVVKMMTGEVRFSYGDAWIADTSLRTNMRKVHRQIGYCPQTDALIDNLTGRETLIIYCLIRGIPISECASTAKQLAREFRFYDHIDQKISQYSVGNKRKLSAAIALIGEPHTIILDEPTIGMDLGSKRFLWNALARIRDNGKCLILVTRHMEECEAICTRVGIMVNGAFQCLGAPHRLKSEFADLFLLIIKLKKIETGDQKIATINEISSFVGESFNSFHRVEGSVVDVVYILSNITIPLSKMFAIMEQAKRTMEAIIADYSLSQFGLEQIFYLFTQRQIES